MRTHKNVSPGERVNAPRESIPYFWFWLFVAVSVSVALSFGAAQIGG